jgi:hypothetical protein
MILHTFGDSHSRISWNFSIPNLQIKQGKNSAYTMARFGLEKMNLIDIKNNNVNDGDMVCFCFGEIDCRSHLCKSQNFKNYKTIINELVFRYFEAIKCNVERYKNLKVIIFNVVPAIHITPETGKCEEFPYIGSDDERKIVTLYMNIKLKEYCEKNNYIFLNVYDKYSDKNGLMNINFKDDSVHIKNPIYIKEFIEKILL